MEGLRRSDEDSLLYDHHRAEDMTADRRGNWKFKLSLVTLTLPW
jgi:hypothetical protein